MRMIVAMAALVLLAPLVYLLFVARSPSSFLARYFIWIYLLLLLGVFLFHLGQRR
jgi:hypothetical protein